VSERERSRAERTDAANESVWESLEWVTPCEAAAWLRVSPKLVYRLATTDRTFPSVKVGGLTRINRPRLERWLERQHRTRKPLLVRREVTGKVGDPGGLSDSER
jgi:excisionase family DNA binding protein